MKKFYLLVILLAFMTSIDIKAQGFPCIRGILTDPFGPSANPKRPLLANTFDWMIDGETENFSISPGNVYYSSNSIPSPFYEQNSFINYLRKFADSDFLPSEGWELLARDFGYKMDGSSTPSDDIRPYIFLYNRYSGMLRILGTLPEHDYNATSIRIGYTTSDASYNLGGLFRNYEPELNGLNELTYGFRLNLPVRYTGSRNKFFHADLATYYDPCTCFFKSGLEWDFEFIAQSEIALKGGTIGTITPITYIDDLDNNKTKISPNDFLSSFLHDYSDFSNVGVQTFKSIDDLINQYQQIADEQQKSQDFKNRLNLFSTLLKIGSTLAIPVIGEEIGKGLKAVLESGSEATKYLAGRSGGGNSAMPMVTQSESVFSGFLITTNEHTGFNYTTPGSLNSHLVPESDYPIYNEVLGVLSVLETPTIQYSEQMGFDTFFGYSANVVFSPKDILKYKINPVLDINNSASKIWGRYLVKIPQDLGPVIPTLPLEMIGVFEDEEENLYDVYKTPLISIHCLEEYAFSFLKFPIGPGHLPPPPMPDFAGIELELQILALLQFESLNRDDQPNEAFHLFTLPVTKNLESDRESVLPNSNYNLFPFEYIDLEITDYNSSTDLIAWNTVTIDGVFENSGSGTITVQGGESVNLLPGAVIKPGFILKSDYPINCSPGESILDHEVSNSYINNFCTSGIYKANQPTARLAEIIEEENRQEEEKDGASIYIYPNPAAHTVNVDWSELEEPVYDVQVIDLTGREILRFESPKGQKLDFSTSGLNENIYIIRIHTGTEIITRKVIIQH